MAWTSVCNDHAQAGHLVMAYAFLKAMGIEGNIGAFTIDLTGPFHPGVLPPREDANS